MCIFLPLLLLISCGQKEDLLKYKDENLPVEERVEYLLSRMTLEKKIEQLSGLGFETKKNKRLGIPVLKMADGPVGVRRGQATAFPAAVGIAATWNTQLVEEIGAAIAKEAKSQYMVPTNATTGKTGLWAEYFPNTKLQGKPVLTRVDKVINFNWGYDAPHPKLHRPNDRNTFSIRWTGKLLPPKTGEYQLNVIHNDGLRLYVDDRLLIDKWRKRPIVFNRASLRLRKGQTYSLRIEYFFDGGIPVIKFGWKLPDHDYLAEAVSLAKNSDAAVIFAGLHNRFESENIDRRRLELPNQDVLINAVEEVNPNTIVVLNAGSPVAMNPWLDKVAAVVQAWYPGQEGGNAIVDVLVGNTNPSGKLPFSFIKSSDDSPAFKDYKDKSLKSPYPEGIFVGYRYLDKHGIEALFPFGHGLSYTSFEYSNLKVNPAGIIARETDFPVTVSGDVRNTGKRKGAEVVQVYVKDVECRIERPNKELKGFARIFLAPGEKKTISIKLNRDAFAFYDPDRRQWVVEPGEFEIVVGSSSKDIRLKKTLKILPLTEHWKQDQKQKEDR
jgi:beta-glucosidase